MKSDKLVVKVTVNNLNELMNNLFCCFLHFVDVIASQRRLQVLLQKFSTTNTTVPDSDFAAIQHILTKLTDAQQQHTEQGVKQLQSSMQQVTEQHIAKIRQHREQCRFLLSSRSHLKEEVLSLHSRKPLNVVKLNDTQQSLRKTTYEYQLEQTRLENGMRELQQEKAVVLVESSSKYFESLKKQCQIENEILDLTEFTSQLNKTVSIKKQEISENRTERKREEDRLRQLYAYDEGIMNAATFAAKISSCIIPPDPIFFQGEKLLLRIEKVINMSSSVFSAGIIFATTFRIIFVPFQFKQVDGSNKQQEVKLSLNFNTINCLIIIY